MAGRQPLTPAQVAARKKRIQNPGGSVSTERSITVGTPGGFINIPTIVGGKQLTNKQAFEAARKSGIKRQRFKTSEEAVSAAKKRSLDIGIAIQKQKKNSHYQSGEKVKRPLKSRSHYR